VRVGSTWLSLGDLAASRRAVPDGSAYRFALPDGGEACIEHGDVRFRVRPVARGRKVAGHGGIDRPLWACVAGAGLVAATFIGLLAMIPADVLAFELEEDAIDPRFAGFSHLADEQKEPREEPEAGNDRPQGGLGQRHDGDEGKMGKPTAKSPRGVYALRGPADAIPQLARNFDAAQSARRAGILGLMAKQEGHFLASIHGGAFAVGNDDEDIWGGLAGTETGEAQGVIGGLGLVGTGRGGGGTGEGTIGLTNTGLIGKGGCTGGSARCRGVGYGPGGGSGVGFAQKGRKVPQVRPQAIADLDGSMDKAVIRRIVRAHINEVRACYNQGLARDPGLRGRVAVQFTIGGTGSVLSAVVGESSLRDAAVGSCVTKAVRRWKFPRPPSGGLTVVTYPFVMDPAT
jgi:TonB family protein